MKIKNFTVQTLNSYENRKEHVTRTANTKIITQLLKYRKKKAKSSKFKILADIDVIFNNKTVSECKLGYEKKKKKIWQVK